MNSCRPGQHVHISNGSKSPRKWHRKQQMGLGIVFAWHEHTCAARAPGRFHLTWPIRAKSGQQKRTLLLVMTVICSHPLSLPRGRAVVAICKSPCWHECVSLIRIQVGVVSLGCFWEEIANLSHSLDAFLQSSLHVGVPLRAFHVVHVGLELYKLLLFFYIILQIFHHLRH